MSLHWVIPGRPAVWTTGLVPVRQGLTPPLLLFVRAVRGNSPPTDMHQALTLTLASGPELTDHWALKLRQERECVPGQD